MACISVLHRLRQQFRNLELTNLSGLLDVESIGDECQVWMSKSHEVGNLHLYLVSWVEEQLDPSIDKKCVRMKNASK
jgi:hypothetical protein